jgi:DNA-binding NarL/FixJ family response regulator
MPQTRVVIVDHQTVFLDALAMTLDCQPDLDVVLAARSVDRVIALAGALAPDVAVVSVDDDHGSAELRRLQSASPATRYVALDGEGDMSVIADVLRSGARGLVRRSDPVTQLVTAVRGAANDETCWPPDVLSCALDTVLAEPKPPSADELLLETLTARERDVLACLVQGQPRSEIARRLYLSPNTVRTHVNNLLRKLDVHSCVAAVALARRASWSPTGDQDPVVRLA